MRSTKAVTFGKAAFLVAFLAIPFAAAPTAHAQQAPEANRDAAMQTCIAAAQKQFPDSDTQSSARVSVYKACMTRAGFRA